MRLTDQRCEEIKSEAVILLESCHVMSYPLDAQEIVKKLNGILIPYSTLEEKKRAVCLETSQDGFSLEYNGSWYVLYNENIGDARIKMTLMHEVAHRRLKHSCESEVAESEARFFAKYIIAPPVIIYALGLNSVSQIMSHFDNSYEAATYSWDYYQKWLMYSGKGFTEQEQKLLRIFDHYINKYRIKEAIAM